MQTPWVWVVSLQHSTRSHKNARSASQEIRKDLGICWYAAIIWIAVITVRNQKTNWWRAQQNWDCWTDWYMGWGPVLHHICPQTKTVRLLSRNILSLASPYLSVQMQSIPMPKDLHSNCYTAKDWQNLLCWREARNRYWSATSGVAIISPEAVL